MSCLQNSNRTWFVSLPQANAHRLIGTPGLCKACRKHPQSTISSLLSRAHRTETRLKDVHSLCASCAATPLSDPVNCESLDCSWLFTRKKLENKAEMLNNVFDYIDEIETGKVSSSASSECGQSYDVEEVRSP